MTWVPFSTQHTRSNARALHEKAHSKPRAVLDGAIFSRFSRLPMRDGPVRRAKIWPD
jgi:hypothetical protein